MKSYLSVIFIRCFALLLFYTMSYNGYGQRTDRERPELRPDTVRLGVDPVKLKLYEQVSSLMGVGCDTAQVSSLIRSIGAAESDARLDSVRQDIQDAYANRNKVLQQYVRDSQNDQSRKDRSNTQTDSTNQKSQSATPQRTTTSGGWGWNPWTDTYFPEFNYVLYKVPLPNHCRWHVSPTGNDNNSIGDHLDPLRTIQEAINRACPGEAIKIANGTYPGFTVNKKVYIVGNLESPESVIIQGNSTGPVITINGSPDIHGLTVTGGKGGILTSGGNPFLSHIVIKNNTSYGMTASNSFTICNSLFYKNLCEHQVLEWTFHGPGSNTGYCINVTFADNQGSSTILYDSYSCPEDPPEFFLINSILWDTQVTEPFLQGSRGNMWVVDCNIHGIQNKVFNLGYAYMWSFLRCFGSDPLFEGNYTNLVHKMSYLNN